MRFAWEWNRKDFGERNQWLNEMVPGWKELGQLMHAVATIVGLTPEQMWILDDLITFDYSPEQLASLGSWSEVLQTHFSFEPLPDSYPQFQREYFNIELRNLKVKGAESSAHQQLEARLYLRNWLQQNAPEHLDLL